MPKRRSTLKRVALWTAAVVVLLVGYVAGAPFVAVVTERYFPSSAPFFRVVYAPLGYVARDRDAPGHEAFKAYVTWCYESVGEILP